MKKIKIIFLALIAILFFTLGACSSEKKSDTSSPSSNVSTSIDSSSDSSSDFSQSDTSSQSSNVSTSIDSSSDSSSDSSQVESYVLTITYVGANAKTPETYTQKYKVGDSYRVVTPSITGYTADNTEISGVMETQNVTATVKYTAISYTISYDYNSGTKGSSNPTTATFDKAFYVSSPTRAGYKFAGWQISGVNTQTALYGNSSAQSKNVYSDLTRCYNVNSEDTDNNGSEYWTKDVYFKNLTAINASKVTLKANWTCLDKIAVANDSASIINSANKSLSNSKVIEIGNKLTGNFVLTFTYYQNALVDETNLAFNKICYRTGILGIGKNTDWQYYTNIRQDAYSWKGTNNIAQITTSSNYTASNNYGDMFYGLAGNNSTSTSVKFANFVRNSLVTYKIQGTKVGQVGGTLKITQTILSLGSEYKNQSISIVYEVNLTDGILYNTGLDICVKAEDTDISFESISYTIMSDGNTYMANGSETFGTLLNNYSHYCPDKYWTGDFDFTFSYNQSQSNYYSAWGDTCWRTGYVVFYEWGNTAEHILLRNDWHGETGASTKKIAYNNTNVMSIGDLHASATGKTTSFVGNQVAELRLFRNASITVRCVRVDNTVTIYQYISSPGSSEVPLLNIYKFTTTIENLSFQIIGIASGITITYEDYSANTKVLKNSSLGATTYGLGTYCFATNNTRAHMALSMPVKKGTTVKFKGSTNYVFSVLEMSKFLGKYDGIEHKSNILYDTTWIDTTLTKNYTISQDCYIAINLRTLNSDSLASTDVLALFKSCIEITINFDNNLNTNEKVFTSSMLPDNSTYGLTTYSGQFRENDTRCHLAIIPLLKKGTVITFTGGTNYNWSVLEMASERIVLHDSTWIDPATITTYTLTRDCYVAINVKYAIDASFEGVDIKTLLYNNIKIEGKCGIINCESAVTHSDTEEGDMQSINHRGYCWVAPENTLAAYATSKDRGFTKVECDINFTSDGYGVLLHDDSINRTTGNTATGNIWDVSFSNVRGYDFGSWKNTAYANEQMPTVEEFLLQCKNLDLHPYLELKNGTKAQIQRLAMLVRRLGMEDNVTWISFRINCLTYVRDVSPGARLGYLNGDINQNVINDALTLRTGRNEVFLDIDHINLDTPEEATSKVALCKQYNLPLEVWTVNSEQTMKNVYNATGGYVTGFTSDNIIAENVNFG